MFLVVRGNTIFSLNLSESTLLYNSVWLDCFFLFFLVDYIQPADKIHTLAHISAQCKILNEALTK